MTHFTEKLIKMNACQDAIDWCLDYDTLEDAWKACKDGNRMDWLINETGKWTPELKATYQAIEGPAWATYEATIRAYATYEATIRAYATYEAECADAIRALYPSPPTI
jgi:hypothetical protein